MGIIDKCDTIGERIVNQHKIRDLPIDVAQIAKNSGIIVEPFPNGQVGNGFAGMLLHRGNDFLIFYSDKIKNIGFQRFTIAHELGHYFIEGHPEAIFDSNGIHKSREPFSSNDRYERQADSFAAGMLMPSELCRPIIRKYDDGLDAILILADACKTSLMSSAIRYAELSNEKIAIIVSKDGKVIFSNASPTMARSGFFIRHQSSIPSTSLTVKCGRDSDFIRQARQNEQEGDLSDWCNHKSCLCLEQVKGLGETGKILTVLVPQEQEDEDEEEDDSNFEFRFR